MAVVDPSAYGLHGLTGLLKRYHGLESFRPLQKEAICTALKGRDSFVLMPTDGNTEAISKWSHRDLSTYNIGDEFGCN